MDRWQQIEELCQSALEREPAQRKAFLQEACGGDEALQREAESLLAYDTDGPRILDRPALQVMAEKLAAEPPTLVGKSLGPYQVLGVLGVGGMGEVYPCAGRALESGGGDQGTASSFIGKGGFAAAV